MLFFLFFLCSVTVAQLAQAQLLSAPASRLNDLKAQSDRTLGLPTSLSDDPPRISIRPAAPVTTVTSRSVQSGTPQSPNAAAITKPVETLPQTDTFEIIAFKVEGNTVLSPQDLSRALRPFQGKARTLNDINLALLALKNAYHTAGYPIVQMSLPEQTVHQGIVILQVQEGRLINIVVNETTGFSKANILASLPALQLGSVPHAANIVSNVLLANENIAKQVAVNFQADGPGGAVQARVNVLEDRVQRWSATYDNAGSVATGVSRLNLGYQHANIADSDHQLSLNIGTTAKTPNQGFTTALGYRVPFYRWGTSLDLNAAYSNFNTSIDNAGSTFNFVGKGTTLGLRLNYNLPIGDEWRHRLSVGMDYKDFVNNCSIAGLPVACGTVTAMPLSLTYTSQTQSPAYQAGGSVSYNANLRGGKNGTAQDYAAARPGAVTAWSVWRLSSYLAMPLPADWQLRLNANAQATSHTLLPSEQMGLGGASSVRGYAERAVAGDAGIVANAEIYTPDFGNLFGEQWKARGLLFYDYGGIRSYSIGSLNVALASYGLGLRMNYGKDLSVKSDLGISLTPNASQTPGNVIPAMPSQQVWGLKQDTDRWGLHVSATQLF